MRVLAVAGLAAAAVYCTPSRPESQRGGGAVQSDLAIAAQKTYVAPGDLDQYYMFASGGHSGQIYVYGIPSMRHISTIPVYTPYPATGYGFDDDSKKMLGDLVRFPVR
jgi:nitrous-oxide reductase